MFKSICHVVVQLFIQTWSTNVFWSFEQTCDQLILLKIHLFFLQRILFPKSCKFNLCKYSHYISWTSFLWLWKPTGWMHACVHTHTHTQSLNHVGPFVTLWTVAHQAPLSKEFSRQEYWSELPFPTPGDLPNPGIKPASLSLSTSKYLTVQT